jgi:DNA-binding PadR family transcriptional regulator
MKARLLILGVLHRGNFHPYEIKRRLKAAMVECYTDVDSGTLYYAIGQLQKEALIAPVAQERVARGGIRTVYAITPAGRAAFRNGLHAQLAEEGPVSQTLYGALLFLHLADPEKAKDALRRRIARLDALIAKLKPLRDQLAPRLATGGEYLLRHIERQRRLDRDWLGDLLAELESHGARDVANPAVLGARTSQADAPRVQKLSLPDSDIKRKNKRNKRDRRGV